VKGRRGGDKVTAEVPRSRAVVGCAAQRGQREGLRRGGRRLAVPQSRERKRTQKGPRWGDKVTAEAWREICGAVVTAEAWRDVYGATETKPMAQQGQREWVNAERKSAHRNAKRKLCKWRYRFHGFRTVLSVDPKVVVEGEDESKGREFRHANEASIGERHRHALVTVH